MKPRLYTSGSKWAFFRWTYTPSGYITRLHLLMTPLGAICIHWINGPDEEPWLHDHPVTFISIPLRRWYREQRWLPEDWTPFTHVVKWWNYIRASREDCHRIVEVAPGGCITLCFMGPKRREWGFHCDTGWVHWKEYNDAKYSKPDSKAEGTL